MEALFYSQYEILITREKQPSRATNAQQTTKPPPKKTTQTATRAATRKPVVLPKFLMTVEKFAGLSQNFCMLSSRKGIQPLRKTHMHTYLIG